MNHAAAHVICDHPEHPAAQAAASQMVLDWMRSIIRECFVAGWTRHCECGLFRLVQAGGGEWGMGNVTEDEASTVRALIEVGGWWRWEDGKGETAIPPEQLAEWRE